MLPLLTQNKDAVVPTSRAHGKGQLTARHASTRWRGWGWYFLACCCFLESFLSWTQACTLAALQRSSSHDNNKDQSHEMCVGSWEIPVTLQLSALMTAAAASFPPFLPFCSEAFQNWDLVWIMWRLVLVWANNKLIKCLLQQISSDFIKPWSVILLSLNEAF